MPSVLRRALSCPVCSVEVVSGVFLDSLGLVAEFSFHESVVLSASALGRGDCVAVYYFGRLVVEHDEVNGEVRHTIISPV